MIRHALSRTLASLAVAGALGLLGLEAARAEAGSVESVDKKEKTGIQWEVSPKHVVIILDGKKIGEAGKLSFTATTPGKHVVKLEKGGDETEMDVDVKKGQTLKFTFSFDEE